MLRGWLPGFGSVSRHGRSMEVIVQFSIGRHSATTQGIALSDEVIECATPAVVNNIGPREFRA
eukprot:5727386-Amphidinium_carterae.1